jgi:hypothetical protein
VASTTAGCILESFTDPERDPQAELFENPPRIANGWVTLNDHMGGSVWMDQTDQLAMADRYVQFQSFCRPLSASAVSKKVPSTELNRPRHQYSLARARASFHETMILGAGGSPAEYRAGIEHAIAKGWLWRHESGAYVKFTPAGADLFA